MSYVELLAWCMDNTIDLCKRQPFDDYSIIFYDFLWFDNCILWFFLWVFYDISMVCRWFFYGLFLSFLYGFLRFSMVPLYFFIVFISFLWSITSYLWLLYEFSMVYYGFSMIFVMVFMNLFYATNLVWQIHKPCVFSPRHKCQSLLWFLCFSI